MIHVYETLLAVDLDLRWVWAWGTVAMPLEGGAVENTHREIA